MKPMNIGIYIYPQAEVLDFSGPFEVFSTANRLCLESQRSNVILIGESGNPVMARGGYQVIPDYGFHNHPPLDVLIVVGGVHTSEMNKPQVIDWIACQAQTVTYLASVCTGVFLLAQARALRSTKVTTHWEDIADLSATFPELEVVEGVRWVDQGDQVTSGGISAGIDMSLHLVSKLFDQSLAEKTARQMEFCSTKNS